MYLEARQPAIERIRYAVVDAQTLGRLIVIRAVSRLIEAVIAKPGFIYPARVRNPGPVQAENLSARVNQSQPLRLQLNRVVHGSGIVAEEIHAAEGVVVVDVIVDFSDGIVRADHIGKTGGNGGSIRSVVCGKPFAIAGNCECRGGTDGAARDV